MKRFIATLLLCILLIGLANCGLGSQPSSAEPATAPPAETEPTKLEPTNFLPDELAEIPSGYWKSAEAQQGTLEFLYYDTYESFTYDEKTETLRKRAVVYLPYGYDETKEYPVFYLMHGGWSDETTYMGTSDDPHSMKNILDHGIANGEILPMIVVCPTYNNNSARNSHNYELALKLTNNYHNELVNDLIPAVDSTYSTIADRDHRAFCGFSMGGIATWRVFQFCLDEFRYFMPSSGSMPMRVMRYPAIVRRSEYTWDDFFIFAASGTNDYVYEDFVKGINVLKETHPFRYANNEVEGNLYYLESKGTHQSKYAMQYFYNGLCWIWQ